MDVTTDDAALLAHGRLLFEHEQLAPGCRLCDAIRRKLIPQIAHERKP